MCDRPIGLCKNPEESQEILSLIKKLLKTAKSNDELKVFFGYLEKSINEFGIPESVDLEGLNKESEGIPGGDQVDMQRKNIIGELWASITKNGENSASAGDESMPLTLPHEPMHDISGHINNLFIEIPNQLEEKVNDYDDSQNLPSMNSKAKQKGRNKCLGKNVKSKQNRKKQAKKSESAGKELKATIESAFEGKEVKHCVDHRAALLKVTHLMKGKVSDDIQMLLETLADVQQILYAYDETRSPRTILRLYNLTFMHAILLKMIIGRKQKVLTRRKFYGKYFHGLIAHSPFQYRLISGAAINVEDKERVFNTIKSITNSTSSWHPGHVIGNAIIQMHVEKKMALHDDEVHVNQMKEVSCLYAIMDKFPNSFFPYDVITPYSREWQAHLERIPDFLLYGEDVWWKQDTKDITFLDSHEEPNHRMEGPALHHFRSWTFEKEVEYIDKNWVLS